MKKKEKRDLFEKSKRVNEENDTKQRFKREERKNSQVVKEARAYGECLGTVRRRRTQQTAKRFGEW